MQGAVLDSILKEEFLTATNPDEGRRAVLDNLRVGANWIKVVADDGPRTINPETMKAIVEEAHRAGVRGGTLRRTWEFRSRWMPAWTRSSTPILPPNRCSRR